jgi:hypothetical protein
VTDASPHLALCLRNTEPGWLGLSREAGSWRGTGVMQSLDGVVPPMLRQIGLNPAADFTFSCARRAAQVMDATYADPMTVEELKGILRGYSVTILAPINSPHYPGLMAIIWRDPRGGVTISKRFAEQTLLDEVERYFESYGALGASAGKRIESGRAGAIELWIRRNWSASEMMPEAFPGPKGHPQAFLDARAAYEARRAKAKGKGKRPPAAAAAE